MGYSRSGASAGPSSHSSEDGSECDDWCRGVDASEDGSECDDWRREFGADEVCENYMDAKSRSGARMLTWRRSVMMYSMW